MLAILLILLLAGAGVLTFARGRRAAVVHDTAPLYVPASKASLLPAAKEPELTNSPPEAAKTVPQSGTFPVYNETQRANTRHYSPAVAKTQAPKGPFSINTATQQELETLPGIGPVYAQRIIAYRKLRAKENGKGFESKDELLNVAGIGPKRFAAIRELITL